MQISILDWIIIFSFFAVFILIGFVTSKKSGKNSKEFFLSGRNMPWWMLGISMVATTFSADTPNLVTNIVRENGVSGNWQWWAFLLTGMMTVFFYAKLWRRSKVLTDLEFYELRYSGNPAKFLRAFRAIYLGVFFNVMIMASVCLAGIKIGGVLLNLSPFECVFYSSVITVFYSSLGGLRSVVITDLIQFVLAMVGSVWACIYILNLNDIGGLQSLINNPLVINKLAFFPEVSDKETFLTILIIPIAVQWWAVWYPGAEPGGGGYIAQRMLSAKNEKNAIYSTLLFNVAHYALRPWPWILIALSSLIIYPTLTDISSAFPLVDQSIIGNDIAYPAMLYLLPSGLLGLVLASLIAAFMSTISSHLNWGASYISLDFYKRFIKKDATEKEIVFVGRISTVVLMLLAGFLALELSDALGAFQILLQIGAGTGSIFLLRWFWWRVNAYSEITGMSVSFLLAIYFQWFHSDLTGIELASYEKLLWSIFITTSSWIIVTLLTKPSDNRILLEFYTRIKPYGIGWNGFLKSNNIKKTRNNEDSSMKDLLLMFLGIITVYFGLFGIGYFIYNKLLIGSIMIIISLISAYTTNYIMSIK
ncbi:MAG: Na+:solute symporter [Flammeovirgaceae bacterium]|nr:Na+:solute symporter [Flammeovirgaceae bacterium]|tara:strand:- start:177 stop:1946 length:1770 start_codon:yes stop_codon:yes gene_type:complete